ncbi:MAG: hypothetical protein SWY16_00435 [Cyanobacteriota bacterium]|nr:hypothetical protein [Cyanobacteriota bacterium]
MLQAKNSGSASQQQSSLIELKAQKLEIRWHAPGFVVFAINASLGSIRKIASPVTVSSNLNSTIFQAQTNRFCH